MRKLLDNYIGYFVIAACIWLMGFSMGQGVSIDISIKGFDLPKWISAITSIFILGASIYAWKNYKKEYLHKTSIDTIKEILKQDIDSSGLKLLSLAYRASILLDTAKHFDKYNMDEKVADDFIKKAISINADSYAAYKEATSPKIEIAMLGNYSQIQDAWLDYQYFIMKIDHSLHLLRKCVSRNTNELTEFFHSLSLKDGQDKLQELDYKPINFDISIEDVKNGQTHYGFDLSNKCKTLETALLEALKS